MGKKKKRERERTKNQTVRTARFRASGCLRQHVHRVSPCYARTLLTRTHVNDSLNTTLIHNQKPETAWDTLQRRMGGWLDGSVTQMGAAGDFFEPNHRNGLACFNDMGRAKRAQRWSVGPVLAIPSFCALPSVPFHGSRSLRMPMPERGKE